VEYLSRKNTLPQASRSEPGMLLPGNGMTLMVATRVLALGDGRALTHGRDERELLATQLCS